jgi:multisubunit Na+/H+ antiporter MnhB subunit
MTSAKAQIVLIPHGDADGGLQTFLVVTISIVLLAFAMMRTYRRGDLDFALRWIARQFRRLFGG